jgi:hypothetical protein
MRVQVPDEQVPPTVQTRLQFDATQESTEWQSLGIEQNVPSGLAPSGRQSVTSVLAVVLKTTQPSPAAQPLPLTGARSGNRDGAATTGAVAVRAAEVATDL